MSARQISSSDYAKLVWHINGMMVAKIGPSRTRYLYLREWRKKRDLTQEQVAGRMGVHPMTVSRWERQVGENKPTIDVLSGLADAYGIEPEDFYHSPGRPTPNQLLRDQDDDVIEQAIRLLTAIRR